MIDVSLSTNMEDVDRANALMVAALALLDGRHRVAAAYLDQAIVVLGRRAQDEGMPSADD